jgi:hypothetical protein
MDTRAIRIVDDPAASDVGHAHLPEFASRRRATESTTTPRLAA